MTWHSVARSVATNGSRLRPAPRSRRRPAGSVGLTRVATEAGGMPSVPDMERFALASSGKQRRKKCGCGTNAAGAWFNHPHGDKGVATRPIPGTAATNRTWAGWAGLVSAGLAVGLTPRSSIAGLTDTGSSAVSAVGSWVIDHVPAGVKDFAIQVFGTADKAALGLGTVIVALILGFFVGRVALHRRWVTAVAFGGFAVVGIAAAFGEPSYQPIATVLAIAGSAAIGGLVLDRLLDRIREAERPTDGVPENGGRRRFVAGVAGVGAVAAVSGVVGRSLVIRRSEDVRDAIALPPAEAPVVGGRRVRDPRPDALSSPPTPTSTGSTPPCSCPTSTRPTGAEVTGMVDEPFTLTYDELLGLPLDRGPRDAGLRLNEVGGDLVGNARWQGVPLPALLDRAGVQAGRRPDRRPLGRRVHRRLPHRAAPDRRTRRPGRGRHERRAAPRPPRLPRPPGGRRASTATSRRPSG